ncbi:ABC transporter substrate-binding protein [Bradyrhizobium sp. RDT10]
MHGDIPSYDPVYSTVYMTRYHAGMVYDQLFGIDAQQNPQPQMVGKYGLSDDKLTWSFELRDGLKFHDGTAVTSADVVPSLRRWAVRNGVARLMMPYVKDISAKDEKTFTIQLKERFGAVVDVLAQGTCFMMRKKEAETEPARKIDTVVGSGPFKFNLNETKPGTQYVYDKNPDYVPRKEPPSGTAGGKIVKVNRVIFINMPDQQTAVAALQAGEIDYYEVPPRDLQGQLSEDKNIRLQSIDPQGQIGYARFNFLHPPFDNVKCRQAIQHIVKQVDYLQTASESKYYKPCASLFACDTPMENDANTAWFKTAPDYAKAKQLLKEGGYDGRPVVLLQSTTISIFKNWAEILTSEMRRAGINVQMEAMDWGSSVTRRGVKAPPDQGGWNIYITSDAVAFVGNPLYGHHTLDGALSGSGWASDPKNEELRVKWAFAETIEERKKIAREMQENAWNYVPLVYFGQYTPRQARRANIDGMLPSPWFTPWWNVDKT